MTLNNPLLKFYENGCSLCGSRCYADRRVKIGLCNARDSLRIASAALHFGEEPPISGTRGSGTIFMSHCSMHCTYCQNYPISQMGVGNITDSSALSAKMIELQNKNAQNINFVTPTHYSFHIFNAVNNARDKGLSLPIVWNTSSYENPETVEYINEIADIYLADIRYSNDRDALEYSGVNSYTEIVFRNIKQFFKSKSHLKIDENGCAVRGLLIRVLLLPGKVNECKAILDFISSEIGNKTYVSLMSQYVPYYKAHEHPELKRRVTKEEYERVIEHAEKLNLENAFIQEIAYTEE
ncbi:MAG: 4Fe-4S cluster-binding domain-containing protein [bacterium]